MPVEWWLRRVQHVMAEMTNYGVLVPFLIGLWYWRRLDAAARIIVLYFGFWSVEGFVNLWSVHVLRTNIYLYHVTVLVETWLLGWAYYVVLRSEFIRRLMLPLGLAFTVVCLLDAFVWSGLSHFNTYARTVQVVLLLALILLYFEQWLQDLRVQPWADFMFVVSVAQAIYYTGSFMPYLLQGTTQNRAVSDAISGMIIATTYLITMMMMTWALWREARSPANDMSRLA
ncbi:hypothetical protein [Hymenobacter sp. CRA2]|uniref:hypothetical protein n=1 Tax=Hymenobacter sp. CRA2 TaxID=1955620 RepID=UPI00098EB921|nr:hypothetical protein [Hymenobacter sp. CRA2]OON68757.1 hypothetical protein B0919_11250 [Hymenobacter sp. CRA2]